MPVLILPASAHTIPPERPQATNTLLSAITGAIPLSAFTLNESLGRILAAAEDASFHR